MAVNDSYNIEATRVADERSDHNMKEVPADKAAQFVAGHQDYPPMTPEMEKRIKRKIDRWMIPLVRKKPPAVSRLIMHGPMLTRFRSSVSLYCDLGRC